MADPSETAARILSMTARLTPIGKDRVLEQLCINTIRTLAMDAVQQANSGHPGTPMALAPVVYTLWQNFLHFDPDDPIWPNRDRFVLSNGHASMLLYAMLHLTGVKAVNFEYERLGEPSVTLNDIKRRAERDHARARLVIPIHDADGKLLAHAAGWSAPQPCSAFKRATFTRCCTFSSWPSYQP